MIRYRVTARRWKHGWELHIDGVGVTQSATLSGAGRMARDYLALDLGGNPDSYDVEIIPELDQELATQVEEARAAVRHAEQAQLRAAQMSRTTARRLRDAGLSGSDTAAVMKISPQRVSQLLRSTATKTGHGGRQEARAS